MYIPSSFAEQRPDVLHAFMREHSFATLVTTGPEGLVATHLPLLLDTSAAGPGVLLGHLAKQNTQWQALATGAEAMAIFQGPHAYVSPRWYESTRAVPTWNYTAVHAYGRPRLITDLAEVRKLLDATVAVYEGTGPGAWQSATLPADYLDGMTRGVVAFAIDLTRLEGKFKLNQNRPAADQAGVIRALSDAPTETERAVANAMRDRLDK
jgi:transcriptional regulator